MRDNYARAYARERVYEGGNDDDPQDPGGRTSRGITQREYDRFRIRKGLTKRDVWTADETEIADIYKMSYWDRVHGDELPPGVDLVLFDSAVNSGVAQAAKWAQRALGITVDGDFGPATLAAINADADNDALIDGILSRRLAMLQGLKTWKRFGKGWAARVANVKKIGQAWASGSVGPDPVAVNEIDGHKKAPPTDAAAPAITQKQATVATAATTAGTAMSSGAAQLQPLADTFSTIKWVFIGLTVAAVLAGVLATYLKNRADAKAGGTAVAVIDDEADGDARPVAV